ncbi:MAG: phage head closure protein [Clostridia bacterium]
MNKIIEIQVAKSVSDENCNQSLTWTPILKAFADVNRIGGKEYYSARSMSAEDEMTFETRFCKALKDLIPQSTRIIFDGGIFDVVFIDDFKEQHQFIKFRGKRQI